MWQRAPVKNYRTVTASPNRDTEMAKEENTKALDFIDRGRLDKAEAALQQALVADVTYGPAHNNLGQLYYRQGKHYLAAWEFEYAIKLMPDRAEPYNNLGLVYEAVGKFDESIEWYSQALSRHPSNAEFLGNLARVRFRRDDKDPQIDYLLRELVAYDSRNEWVCWAREQLALSKRGPLGDGDRLPAPPAGAYPGAEDLPLLPPPRSLPLELEKTGPVLPDGAE